MPIYLNGAQNPESVLYNGAVLDSVYASTDGGQSSVKVWDAQIGYPSTFDPFSVDVSGGFDMWMRNAELTRAWRELWPSDGSLHSFAEYSCEITLEVSFPYKEYVTGAHGGTASIQWRPSTCYGSMNVSGVMSGYSFHSLVTTRTMNLDFLKTVEGSQSTIEGTVNVDCTFSMNPTMFLVTGEYVWYGTYNLFTAHTGFIYQGPAKLVVEKT